MTLEHLSVLSYELFRDLSRGVLVDLQRCYQVDGSSLWAIRCASPGGSHVLCVDGTWIVEPPRESRTPDLLDRARWMSPNDACAFWYELPCRAKRRIRSTS